MQKYLLSPAKRLFLAIVFSGAACFAFLIPSESFWLSGLLGAYGIAAICIAIGWLFFYQSRRLPQAAVWLPLAATPLMVVSLFIEPSWFLLLVAGLQPVLFMVAGWGSYHRQPPVGEIPHSPFSWLLALKVALDEVVLGYFVSTVGTPPRSQMAEITDESLATIRMLEENGWLDAPRNFHQAPATPEVFELLPCSAQGHAFKRLRFASPYQPQAGLPGEKRWSNAERLGMFEARIFEHEDGSRPWLMCVHGYRMGWPYMDFQLFSPGWLHHKLGFNVLMPVLPLHGPRKQGLRTGDGFFDGHLVDMLHAEAQAQADLRACLYWLRSNRTVSKLGVYGISLGGLNASLLSCLEQDIDSVVAGIPLVKPSRVLELNAKRRLLSSLAERGVGLGEIELLLSPVSPLNMNCLVPQASRGIVAGEQDRIVPLEPIAALHAHWEGCRMHWFEGSHLSIRREASVSRWLVDTWQAHGVLPKPGVEDGIGILQPANAGRE